jgi:Sporulation and spore germination
MRQVLRGLLVLALTAVLTACLASEDSCACQYPDETARYDVYLLTGFGADAALAPMEIRDDSGRDPAVVAVTSLLHTTPPADADLVNGWSFGGEALTELHSVVHRNGVVTVDLAEDVWDPFPTADFSEVPDGRLTLQQLVWTVQEALDTKDPVRVTVNGERSRGVWLYRASWPVTAAP